MESKKTAVIYTRVSSTKQKKEGDSLRNQEKLCREYCSKNNMIVKKVFEDDFTWTGTSRPGLDTMYKYIQQNPGIHFCIIKSIDRGSRGGVGVYEDIKSTLEENWVLLRDTYWVIQWKEKILDKIGSLELDYKFCYSDPSRMNQVITAISSEEERMQILRRTIPREIELEQQGYHVRESNFWYKLLKVDAERWKAKIQIPHPIEWAWIIKAFELKALWGYSSDEIAEELNILGAETRRKNSISWKYLDTLFVKPIYAGFIVSKWTNQEIIRAQYQGLVSIELWNKVNKGKRRIVEKNDGSVELIEYKKQKNEEWKVVQKRRKKFDTKLPYRNLIKSSQRPEKLISWSISNTKRNKPTAYYHVIRKKWEKGENIRKQEFHDMIESFFWELQIHPVLRILFEDKFDEIFEGNRAKINSKLKQLKDRKIKITKEIKQIEDKIYSFDTIMMRTIKIFEKKLCELEKEVSKIEQSIWECEGSDFIKPEKFKEFCFSVLEHLGEFLKQSQSLEELSLIFQFVFKETPEYNDIVNRTSPLQPIFALQSKKEPQIIWSSSVNRKWHPH